MMARVEALVEDVTGEEIGALKKDRGLGLRERTVSEACKRGIN
jgi:hypothetical protein